MNNKTVSLILGSGGARGLAHIGIIQELEKQGFKLSLFQVVPSVH